MLNSGYVKIFVPYVFKIITNVLITNEGLLTLFVFMLAYIQAVVDLLDGLVVRGLSSEFRARMNYT